MNLVLLRAQLKQLANCVLIAVVGDAGTFWIANENDSKNFEIIYKP